MSPVRAITCVCGLVLLAALIVAGVGEFFGPGMAEWDWRNW